MRQQVRDAIDWNELDEYDRSKQMLNFITGHDDPSREFVVAYICRAEHVRDLDHHHDSDTVLDPYASKMASAPR